ncbi:MAG: hypothetical protein SGILL_007813 [Bacillariaceae sp.]
MNSRIQKLFGISVLFTATLLFLALDPAHARGDLRVYRQGLDVEIEDADVDSVADDDVAEILEELDGLDFEGMQGIIDNLMSMKESEAIATEEEMIADNEEGSDEDDVGVEEDSEDSEDELLEIDSIGIESSIPGCSKPEPPTPAPVPVCDSDDEGKGGKGGKKSRGDDDDGKGRGKGGKKGGSYHHKDESKDEHDRTYLEVPCGSQLVLAGSDPCAGSLTVIEVPVDAATVVLTANIVCEGRGSVVAVCPGVTLDGDQNTISADGRRGSTVFLAPGSSLTNTVVDNFRTGVVALSFPGGPVTITDTVIQGNSRSGMIAFLLGGTLSMTNVDILGNRRNGMVLIPIQSTVTMDTLNINGNRRRGIIVPAMTGSTWTANALNTSQNLGNGIAVFTIPRASNTVNFDGVVSNENGRNGLRIRHFTGRTSSWTIENSEFSHNGQRRRRDGINAVFPRGTFTLSNVKLNGNSSDGLDLRSFRRSNQISLEHIEAVGNADDGIDLERRGTVSFDSIFACANEDEDIDVRNYLVTSWSDTTCDTRDLFRNLRNLRCSMDCPAGCDVRRT